MRKRTVSILLALCLGLAVPAMAANSDAVYGTENDHVIPQSVSGTTVTTPDGTFTVTNVLK